jgi:hypothetical protein
MPNHSTKFLHLGPALSFLLKYANNLCRRCTISLRFRLFSLSLLCRLLASTLILVVRIATCTFPSAGVGPRAQFGSEGVGVVDAGWVGWEVRVGAVAAEGGDAALDVVAG